MLDAFAALHAVGEKALLEADLGGREHLAHLVDQRIDQVVVDPLIALQKKARQVEACHALRKVAAASARCSNRPAPRRSEMVLCRSLEPLYRPRWRCCPSWEF